MFKTYILLLFCSILCLTSCKKTTEQNTYTIEGKFNNAKNGEKIYLKTTKNRKTITIDSAIVSNESFSFDGQTNKAGIHYLTYDNDKKKLGFILSNSLITAVVYKDSLHLNNVYGDAENNALNQLNDILKSGKDKSFAIKQATFKAIAQKDSVKIDSLRLTFESFEKTQLQNEISFIEDNSTVLASVYRLQHLIKTHKLNDFNEINRIYNTLSDANKQTKHGKQIEDALRIKERLLIGKPAPNFSAKQPDGNYINLKDTKGPTLIYFWFSRNKKSIDLLQQIKQLSKTYPINYIGISLDNKKDTWINTLSRLDISENQISNLMYLQCPIAKSYDISNIPNTFLIDNNHKIVASGLLNDELEEKIKEFSN